MDVPKKLYRGIKIHYKNLENFDFYGVSLKPQSEFYLDEDGQKKVMDGNEYGIYMSDNVNAATDAYGKVTESDGTIIHPDISFGDFPSENIRIPAVGIVYEIHTDGLDVREPKICEAMQGHYNNGFEGKEWIADFIPAENYSIFRIQIGNDALHDSEFIDTSNIHQVKDIVMQKIELRRERLEAFARELEKLSPNKRRFLSLADMELYQNLVGEDGVKFISASEIDPSTAKGGARYLLKVFYEKGADFQTLGYINKLNNKVDSNDGLDKLIEIVRDDIEALRTRRNAFVEEMTRDHERFSTRSFDHKESQYTDILSELSMVKEKVKIDNGHKTKELQDSFDANVSNHYLMTHAPFWTEKRYRIFLKEPMEEEEFSFRLRKAFEHDAELHPEYREAIFRGENEALVQLVAEEYLFDLSFAPVEEHVQVQEGEELVREREMPVSIDNEEEIEEETVEEDFPASDLEEEVLEQEEDNEEAEKIAKEKRAAFSKKRNEQYAKGNAESDKRHWEENARQEAWRLLEEERRRVRETYEKGFYVPEYTLPVYATPNYETPTYPLPDFSNPNFKYEQYQAEVQRYSAERYFYESQAEFVKYEQPRTSQVYHSYESEVSRTNFEEERRRLAEEEKKRSFDEERRRVSEEAHRQRQNEKRARDDQEYYQKMHDAENYQRRNTDGHFSFDERSEVGQTGSGHSLDEKRGQSYETDYRYEADKAYEKAYHNQQTFVDTESQAPAQNVQHDYRSQQGRGGAQDYKNPSPERSAGNSGNHRGPVPPVPPINSGGGPNNHHSTNNRTGTVPKKDPTQNRSVSDPFKSREKTSERVKERFQKFSENSLRAVNNVRYLSAKTGYTAFVERTNQALLYYAHSEMRSSDNLSDSITAWDNFQRKKSNIQGVAAAFALPISSSLMKQSAMDKFVKADLGRESFREQKELLLANATKKELKKFKAETIDSSKKEFLDAIKSKKTRTKFLESRNVFDFSSKKLKEEIKTLKTAEKRGRLTKVQEDRLKQLRNGTSIADVDKKLKKLLKKEKQGLLTNGEKLELFKLKQSKAVLGAKGAWVSRLGIGIRSAYNLFRDAAFKSDDAGMSGLLKSIDFAYNPYVQKTVKNGVKFVRLSGRTGLKVVKAGGKKLLNVTPGGKALKEAASASSSAVKSAVKKKIKMVADSKAGRFVKSGVKTTAKATGKIRHPFKGKVSGAVKKVTNVISKPFRFLNKIIQAVKGFIAKLAIIVGGFLLFLIIIGIISSAISSAAAVIEGDIDESSGKINLIQYTKILKEESEKFSETIHASVTDGNIYYGKIKYNLTYKENLKEILSMASVRFQMDLTYHHTVEEISQGKCEYYPLDATFSPVIAYCDGHLTEGLEDYLRLIYQNSHQLSLSYGDEYSCGGVDDECPFPQEEKTKVVVQEYVPASIEYIYDDEGNIIGEREIPEVPEIVEYHCPGEHRDVTVQTEVLGFDEIFSIEYATMAGNSLSNFSGKQLEFINLVSRGAMNAQKETGILASVTIAQACLESNWGNSGLAKECNNLFGMKAGSSWNGKTKVYTTKEQNANGSVYSVEAAFRVYNSIEESIIDHGKVLMNSRYQAVRDATTYQEQCEQLKVCGYATDVSYPQKLMEIIEAYNLSKYDSGDQTAESSITSQAQSMVVQLAKKKLMLETVSGECQKWVANVYHESGVQTTRQSQCCATAARNAWKVSNEQSKIPLGATIYSGDSYQSGVTCSCGKNAGHVGIYIGDGQVASNVGTIKIVSLDEFISSFGWGGWGWNGGQELGSGFDGTILGGFEWDESNIGWAKVIYNANWDELYLGIDGLSTDIDYSEFMGDYFGSMAEVKICIENDLDLMGVKYAIGGNSPETGFDSSGFVNYVLSESGTYDVYQWSSRPSVSTYIETCIPVSKKQAKPGDIVYWENGKTGNPHIGILLEINDVRTMVYHVDPKKGVTCESAAMAGGSYKIYRLPK